MGASASLSVRGGRRAFCHACRRWLPLDEDAGDTPPECPCGSDFVELMEDEQQVVQLTGDLIADILTAARGVSDSQGRGGLFALRMLAESTNTLTRALRASMTDNSGKTPADPNFVDSLPTISIDKTLASNEITCSVCTVNFEYRDKALKLPCNHLFHGDCIKPWFKTAHTCPMCRHELPKEKDEDAAPAAAAPATRTRARNLRAPRHRYRSVGLREALGVPFPSRLGSSGGSSRLPPPQRPMSEEERGILEAPLPARPVSIHPSSDTPSSPVRAGGTVTHSHTPTSQSRAPLRTRTNSDDD